MTIGEVIEELLNEYDLNQSQFAKKIGVSHRAISHWIAGDRSPNYEIIKLICEAFDLPPDYVLGFSDYGSDSQKPSEVHKNTEYDKRNAELLTDQEKELLNFYRMIPPGTERGQALGYVQGLADKYARGEKHAAERGSEQKAKENAGIRSQRKAK